MSAAPGLTGSRSEGGHSRSNGRYSVHCLVSRQRPDGTPVPDGVQYFGHKPVRGRATLHRTFAPNATGSHRTARARSRGRALRPGPLVSRSIGEGSGSGDGDQQELAALALPRPIRPGRREVVRTISLFNPQRVGLDGHEELPGTGDRRDVDDAARLPVSPSAEARWIDLREALL